MSQNPFFNKMAKYLLIFCVIFITHQKVFADLSANQYFVNVEIKYSQMPKPSPYANAPIRNITIGDLHGNILTLFHIFVLFGVLKIDPEHAEEIKGMYNHVKEIIIQNSKLNHDNVLTVEEFKFFQHFLNGFQVIDRGIHIRLLDDTLSERNSNDILNLELMKKIFSKLSPEKLEIIYSNHDNSFFIFNFSAKKTMPVEFIHSALTAQKFLKKNPAYRENFLNSIQEYVDHLNMFSADEQLERIYSHAVLSQKILDACFIRTQNHLTSVNSIAVNSTDAKSIDVNSIDLTSINNSYKIKTINSYLKQILKNMVNMTNFSYIADLSPSGRVFVEFGLSPAVKTFLNHFYWESYSSEFVQSPFYWALWSDISIKKTMNYVNKFGINLNKMTKYSKNNQIFYSQNRKSHYDYLPTDLHGNLLFTEKLSLGSIQNNIHGHTLNFRLGEQDATLDNSVGQKLVFIDGKYHFQDSQLIIEVEK